MKIRQENTGSVEAILIQQFMGESASVLYRFLVTQKYVLWISCIVHPEVRDYRSCKFVFLPDSGDVSNLNFQWSVA